MGFESLRFFNFRNLKDGELDVKAREVFLVGQNGQGKTNLLEAVHLLSLGSSFREKKDNALSRDPSSATGLNGRYVSPESGSRDLSLQFAAGRRKEIRVNDKPLAERRDLLSEVLCVCFVQQDMDFITGTPEDRRRFFDQTLVLADLSFLDTLRGYRQVLKSRNLCLKQGRDDLLDVYDAQLASLGLNLQGRRADLVREFDAVFKPLFCQITGSDQGVSIRYRPSWEGLHTTEQVMAHLAVRRERDRIFGATVSGPHRDACFYLGEGRDYSHFASTGQLRLCALTLRVAQVRFLAARTGRRPVLLLDDVLLELDPGRKSAFLSRFPPYEQAFFTFLPDESWQSYRTPETLVLTVERGAFHP
ncbi:MAG: DNA replication and repair protein RecF [Spirochaetia bacterium]|jgi:DNA replication and repair protein RecF